jgi:uroporphyrinogen decarboxylase
MCYMVEGRGGDFMHARLALRSAPKGVHHVLEGNATAVSGYLCGQADAGADVGMLFESWGDILSDPDFEEFSERYLRRIVAEVRASRPDFPLIVFVRAGERWCERIAAMGCQAIGIDWRADLSEVRARTKGQVAIQGNIDPAILLAEDPATVRIAAESHIMAYGSEPGHILNLGHGVDRRTPVRNVEALVEAAKAAGERLLGSPAA